MEVISVSDKGDGIFMIYQLKDNEQTRLLRFEPL
jgi:hypothetical protein